MKLCFIFDTVMLKDEETDDYYAINLNYKLWKDRYLPIFNEIIVSTRVRKSTSSEIKKKTGYTIANGQYVEMQPITHYNKITDVFVKRKKIYKQLEQIITNCDCVIIRLPSPLGNLACNICRKLNKKYAIEMVACAWDGYRYHGHWAGRLVAPYMLYKTKQQCKLANRVLYVTKNFLQKRYPTKGITTNISNVMINESTVNILQARLDKIKNFNSNRIVLGLVGPLELYSKGHEIALKAMTLLKEKYNNIIIEFLGNGNEKRLEQISNKLGIRENIIFKGTLPSGEAVLKWMDEIDILLVPSFQEGLPRVLIEGMSRGCPAVGAETGGIPELIRKEFIHKPGNYEKLAENIQEIVQDKELALELAKENFENSKIYAKERLNERRNKFWKEFANE